MSKEKNNNYSLITKYSQLPKENEVIEGRRGR